MPFRPPESPAAGISLPPGRRLQPPLPRLLMNVLIRLPPNECDAKLKDARRHCHKSNDLSSIYYFLNSITFLLQSSPSIRPAAAVEQPLAGAAVRSVQPGLRQCPEWKNLSLEGEVTGVQGRPASIFPVRKRIQSSAPGFKSIFSA